MRRNGGKTVARYYSSLLVDLNTWSDEIDIPYHENKAIDSGQLKLIFKVYPGGEMTNYLNSLQRGDILHVQGPLGPGLLLHEFKGNYLAFAGGTGLVPFLDLVYYAWQQINPDDLDFYLTLLVSFRTYSDGFALEILEKMNEITEGKWLKVIILHDKSLDKGKVPEIVKKMTEEKIDKAWICGPSGFNAYYYDLLLKYGIDKLKIIQM